MMTSIDLRDAEVQQHFTAIRKATHDHQKEEIAQQISRMYERSQDYSYGIFTRTIKFISESNDREDKKIGLMVLSALGPKIQGTARSLFVNKFHSPVFKLIEATQDQYLIVYIERAYEIILQIGGNRNDSAVENNLLSCFSVLQSKNSREVSKIATYGVLRILVCTSPYITFKKLMQKQKNTNLDNLSLAIASAKVRNIKVRQAYLKFLIEYVKYIAEKKDQSFQKVTFQRFYETYMHISPRDTNEELNHLYLETINIFMEYLPNLIPPNIIRSIMEYTVDKIHNNKNPVIQKSLIKLLPYLSQKKSSEDIISVFLKYLRTIEGEAKIISQQAINMILDTTPDTKQNFLPIYRDIIQQILLKFKNVFSKSQSYTQIIELSSIQIKTIQILIKKYHNNHSTLISAPDLDDLVSWAMLIRLDQETLKLLTDIAKHNIHNLGRVVQIKFIITISKILTGSTRKVIRDANQQFKPFLEILELKQSAEFLENQTNKVRAIQALSQYRFREEFRDVVGGFVKDRVLKYYLEWGNSKMKIASVQAAFFLYAKKGKNVATNQLLQVIDKLLRVGLTDADQSVREKVFMSIAKNFKRHQQFLQFFTNISLLSYLFQAVEDRNQNIRLWSLKIVCILYNKNPSVMITPFLKKITYNCFYHLSSNFKYHNHKCTLIQSIIIIIEYAPSIIENHIDSLLNSLLNYLQDRNNYEGLELLFFDLIKTLTQVLPNSIIPYVEAFSQHLVIAMKDKLNTKNRLIALKTFISIIRQCGYVVIPYFQIASLKETLAFLIRSEIEEQSRNDIMRIIGALGAVDNLRFSMILSECGSNRTPQNLIKSLHRLKSSSNFLSTRAALLQQKSNNLIDKQLKLYYDELILMQNNQKLILLTKQNPKISLTSESTQMVSHKIEIQIDSSMNFHMIILKSLFQILDDKSLSEKHPLTLDVLTQLLQLMGTEIQKQLPNIMQILLTLVKSNEQILNLIYILGENCDISQFVGELVTFIISQSRNIELSIKLLNLITGKYNQILRYLMQLIVDKLHNIIENYFSQSQLMVQVSFIYQNVRNHLEPYLTIIIPQIMEKFFLKNSQTTNAFIDFIMNLSKCCSSILQFMPIITSYFAGLLNLCDSKHIQCKPCLRVKLCNCIVLFITIFKGEFISYLPTLHKSILKDQDIPNIYFKAIRYLQNCSFGNISAVFTTEELDKLNAQYNSNFAPKFDIPKYHKRVDGIEQLIHEFDPIGKKIVDEDWVQWLKKTSIFLLKKSPNSLLRTCSVLADEYNELGLQLYNISFFHFWQILVDEQKKILIDNIKKILIYNPKPFLLVRKTFLNLAEFMNRKKCSFELSSSLLAECAGESSSFAKQLYYREQQFQASPQRSIQSLIDTYMKLGQPENAYGLFKIANSLGIHCKIQWYQKIGKFQQAYNSYMMINDQRSLERIKCLSYISDDEFIGQFEKLATDKMTCFSQKIQLLAVEAYANLQKWQKCEQTLTKVQTASIGKCFWSSVIQVKKGQYTQAMTCIGNTRKLLYEEIPDWMNFSSTSEAFEKFICMQQLFELEEIVLLKQKQLKNEELIKNIDEADKIKLHKGYLESSDKLKSVWNDRLIGCSKNSNTFKRLSIVRSLFFTKAQYFDFYYEFCEIFIKQGKIGKCQQLIKQIKSQLMDGSNVRKLELLQLLEIKIDFTLNKVKNEEQISKIEKFLQDHSHLDPNKIGQIYYLSAERLYENSVDTQRKPDKIISLLEKSAQLCNSQREWYILSIINLQFAESLRKPQIQQKHIINALIALTNSLKIVTNENEYYLQGYLKLLSVLCNHSKIQQVYDIFQDNFKNIPVQGWINVVPQMIAQLYQLNEESNFVKILKMLLKNLGIQHPESVLFSLNFALKSKIEERTKPARQIIDFIKTKHCELAEEVQKISNQLGRTAIKLKEYWFDGIESAWSIYNQNKNADQIILLLKQICENVMNRKDSNSQIAFHQQFGQQIRDGYSWLLRFEQTHEPICISQVFQIFYSIYKKVKDSFENIKKVYLKNVAPFLVASKKYKSTIPGLYIPNKPSVRITGFCNQLIILQSKQRPRKLTIYGDDGKEYNFLLKGREDLRLDERVMQFFSLVNKLLAVERENLKRNLQITRYSIIPLTVNTGLIGWVQNCDTLNELIKEYRTVNKIRVYVEKQLYEKMCPDYAYLPVVNKLEIFKSGLQSTQGKDLQKILWLKSSNSEVWVQKRNNYTSSLATMSIVGYILGLGDRHPSNIMLKRDSGKIVHIDFGDCFQVAVLRQKFPEKVPFRLTRMLQKAMGIPGIHGLYRFTCQMVMKILRQNKESLFGVLQTFAQDPIISWRLTNEKKEDTEKVKFQLKKNINDEIIGSIMEGLQMEINQSKALGKNGQADIDEEHPRRTQQETQIENKQQINQKAVKALLRIKQKLKGTDFDESKQLTVQEQVTHLIQQATSAINICQSWPGWCPFW